MRVRAKVAKYFPPAPGKSVNFGKPRWAATRHGPKGVLAFEADDQAAAERALAIQFFTAHLQALRSGDPRVRPFEPIVWDVKVYGDPTDDDEL